MVSLSDFSEENVDRVEKAMGVRICRVLIQQQQLGAPAKRIGAFELECDNWVQEHPTFLSMPISVVMPGYQNAVYRRAN